TLRTHVGHLGRSRTDRRRRMQRSKFVAYSITSSEFPCLSSQRNLGADGIIADRTWWTPVRAAGATPHVDSWPRHGLVERAGLRSRGPFLTVVPVGRCTPRRRSRPTSIAKDDRQTVFAVADDDCFRIRGLRKLKRRLDAAPAQIGIRNALAH